MFQNHLKDVTSSDKKKIIKISLPLPVLL